MKQIEPPSMATWMLRHLTPGEYNEAMAGDLLEEYRNGRSTNWYWRQVLAAVTMGNVRELLHHRTVFAFAALWSMLAPAWSLYVFTLEAHSDFVWTHIWKMDWPWSTLCQMSLALASRMIFIWAGLVLCLILQAYETKSLDIRQVCRRLMLSVQVFIAVSVVVIPLFTLFAPDFLIDYPSLTPLGEITDFRMWTLVSRLQYFLTLLGTLWGATSHAGNKRTRFAA